MEETWKVRTTIKKLSDHWENHGYAWKTVINMMRKKWNLLYQEDSNNR